MTTEGIIMNRTKKITIAAAALTVGLLTTAAGCGETAAKTAGDNISTAADNFEVQRKIVGVNTRTDKFLFYVEGRCSIDRQGDLIVTCKHGENDYRKHYVGQATDVSWVSTQMGPIDVSEFNTRVIIKPEGLIPDLELKTSLK
jgi:hypothetical protein